MRDLRDNQLLKRLGYVSEAAAYNNETDGPDARRYVSAVDDNGGAVYAVRRSGVPVLLVADVDALTHYERKGHAWSDVLDHTPAVGGTIRVVGVNEFVFAFALRDIRKYAPELLDQQSGKALFNVADALRLLAKYDAHRAAKRAARKGAR